MKINNLNSGIESKCNKIFIKEKKRKKERECVRDGEYNWVRVLRWRNSRDEIFANSIPISFMLMYVCVCVYGKDTRIRLQKKKNIIFLLLQYFRFYSKKRCKLVYRVINSNYYKIWKTRIKIVDFCSNTYK